MTCCDQVTGSVHISTQKEEVKVAKILLEVEGSLSTSVTYTARGKKGKRERKTAVNVSLIDEKCPPAPATIMFVFTE